MLDGCISACKHVFHVLSVILACSSLIHAYTDYCIIGAGPGGLQMGYFMQRAGLDYVIFERSNVSGNFFVQYPRHRTLISINKRWTGKTNKEFNLRHDWNSLISDDEDLLFTRYSKEMFPPADRYLDYLRDYQKKLNINVQFNTEIRNVRTEICENVPDSHIYTMEDQHGIGYRCGSMYTEVCLGGNSTKIGDVRFEYIGMCTTQIMDLRRKLIVATGVWKPVIPEVRGIEHTDGYETMSLDTEDYEGKTVLILGRGNSAFETANHIYGSTNLIHMVARSRVRLSWATHYVGDLRAVNNALLDTYQLKSLDGVLEASINEVDIVKQPDGKLMLQIKDDEENEGEGPEDSLFDNFAMREPYDKIIRCLGFTVDKGIFNESVDIGKVMLQIKEDTENEGGPEDSLFDNFAMREPYDKIIRCLGFTVDKGIFNESMKITSPRGRAKKYMSLNDNFESADNVGMFIAGTAAHALDFRKSAGGFIHGFRYTARALFHLLQWRYEGVQWPSYSAPISQLTEHILKRINEASGTYQMFSVLGDVIILHRSGNFTYIEEFPIKLVHQLYKHTGHAADRIIVINLQYGADFSGPGNDIFRPDRATGDPSEAHKSNFLHPCLYYYETLPSDKDMKAVPKKEHLPRPTSMHHMVEDFLTTWDGPVSHILPLRRFLENIVERDMRNFYADDCLYFGLTGTELPYYCKEYYMKGQGMSSSQIYADAIVNM